VVVVVLVVVVLVVVVLVDVLIDVLVGALVVEVLVLGDVVGDVIDDDVVDVAVRGGSVVPVTTTVVVVTRAAVPSRPSDRAVELQAVNAPASKRRSVLARRSDTQLRVAPQPRPATAPLAGLRSSYE